MARKLMQAHGYMVSIVHVIRTLTQRDAQVCGICAMTNVQFCLYTSEADSV